MVNVFYNPNNRTDSVQDRSDAGAIIFGVISDLMAERDKRTMYVTI